MYMKKSTLIISCFAGISMVALAGCGDSSSGTDAKDAADEASEKYFPDTKKPRRRKRRLPSGPVRRRLPFWCWLV